MSHVTQPLPPPLGPLTQRLYVPALSETNPHIPYWHFLFLSHVFLVCLCLTLPWVKLSQLSKPSFSPEFQQKDRNALLLHSCGWTNHTASLYIFQSHLTHLQVTTWHLPSHMQLWNSSHPLNITVLSTCPRTSEAPTLLTYHHTTLSRKPTAPSPSCIPMVWGSVGRKVT